MLDSMCTLRSQDLLPLATPQRDYTLPRLFEPDPKGFNTYMDGTLCIVLKKKGWGSKIKLIVSKKFKNIKILY